MDLIPVEMDVGICTLRAVVAPRIDNKPVIRMDESMVVRFRSSAINSSHTSLCRRHDIPSQDPR